jgi:hypothetical protein
VSLKVGGAYTVVKVKGMHEVEFSLDNHFRIGEFPCVGFVRP